MQILAQQEPDLWLEWLSTHPDTAERIRSITLQIQRNHYNPFAYEGIERHEQIQQRLRELQGNENEAVNR